jgi:DNA (cytosine-5)-methyltransferase 1
MNTYSLVDLFAGCGAMTRGFVETERFVPIFAVESDPKAATTYAVNFGFEHVHQRPIQKVRNFPTADVVIGGPPCQGFSTLNRSRDSTESRRRWRDYLRALKASEPYVFVMENVPQMLKSPEYAAFVRAATKHGYTIDQRVLNVADYGVPQRRRRAIVIGSCVGSIPWPTPTHSDPRSEAHSATQPWVSFADAVSGLPLEPDGKRWHRTRNPRPETLRRYAAVPHDGGSRFQMQEALERDGLGHLVPPCWQKHRNGSYDVFGRLWWDQPATTIRTEFHKPEKGRYLHPSEDRAITVREAARLMSFPDDFELLEDQSMTAVARQIGNAVPPLMARRLAEVIALALDDYGAARPGLELVA